MQQTIPAADMDAAPRPLLFGHPRVLPFLAATEFWDRVSFHGLQALLTLFMVEYLLLPGHIEQVAGFPAFRAAIEWVTGPLSTQALASQIFGLYVGFALFAPILGAAIGDRWLGRPRSVVLGGLLMTGGHACMAFDASFLLALLLLVVGTGFLRGNLPPQVGDLYDPADRRRAVAFQIYGAGVNLGAFLAPVVTGALAQSWGWHVGFAFAAVGMSIGLVVYLFAQPMLPRTVPRQATSRGSPMTRADWRRIGLLVAAIPLFAAFWVAQSQVWNTYNLWVRDHLQLQMGAFRVPVPWLQSIDGLAPLVSLPLILAIWGGQARRGREPDEFGKIALGCFLFAAGTVWLACGQFVTDASGRTPFLWAVVFHIVSNLGWVYFAPTANAFFSRAAPVAVTATVMSFYSLAVSLGSVISGRLGGLYEHLAPVQFWTLHAAIVAAGGVAVLIYGAAFRRRLFGGQGT